MGTRIRVLVGAALLIGVAVAVVVGVNSYRAHHRPPFVQRVWKKPMRYCVKSPRARMVDDLISNKLKRGMPMRRVRALLGPPDGEFQDEWLYYVSREPSLTHEGCVSLSLRTDGHTLRDAGLSRDSG